jgi:hypothetical protein
MWLSFELYDVFGFFRGILLISVIRQWFRMNFIQTICFGIFKLSSISIAYYFVVSYFLKFYQITNNFLLALF